MKYLLFLILTTTLFSSTNGLYFEAGAGTNLSNKIEPDKAQYGYNYNIPVSVSIGYQGDLFRFEIEELYMKNKITSYTDSISFNASGDVLRTSTFLNTYIYKIKNKTETSIGLGVGATNINIDNLIISNAQAINGNIKNIPTIKGSFSVGRTINEDLTLVLKYSYIASQSYTISNIQYKRLSDNIISAHFRYLF